MAKKKEDKSKAAAKKLAASDGNHSRFVRYMLILTMAGVVTLVWLSLVTYSPNDPPVRNEYPRAEVHNAAGVIGSYLAYCLRYYLGTGVYMGLLFASIAACILVLGGKIGDLPWRIIGVSLMIVATSTSVYLLTPDVNRELASSSSGVLGTAVGVTLLDNFNSIGSWILVLISFFIGIMLTADHLVLRIPSLSKKAWAKRKDLAEMVGAFKLNRQKAAKADSRGVTSAPRAAAASPVAAMAAQTPKPTQPTPKPVIVGQIKEDEKKKRVSIGSLFGGKDKPKAPKAKPEKPVAKSDVTVPTASKEFVSLSADLLAEPSGGYIESQEAQALEKRRILQQTLNDFNVQAEVVGHMTGPVITMFELSLAPGVKVAQVANLSTDIARALAVPGVRLVTPIPGKDTIGIEVPNLDKEIVRMKELMTLAPEAEKKMHLPLYLGKDAGGQPIVADLAGMPHMLIAGTTGSGKSVCINSIITGLLMLRSPADVRFILIDPKMVEMAAFENLPHLLCPIVNDMRRAEDILEWAATKMDERYEFLKEAGVRNIAAYNKLTEEDIYESFGAETDEEKANIPTHLPYYVIIVDELADLIMTSSKEVETHIIRIAQKARAVGIHMILATQRPSVNVVTGLIKSNMPCRISFRVASRQESRIVLDQNGADVLLGGGDMLFLQPGTSNLSRAQGTYLDDGEIRAVVKAIRKTGEPQFNTELMRLNTRAPGEGGGEKDELFEKAVEIVLASQRGSVSLLQRRLSIGYSRASRIIDQMADSGLLGEYKGSQARECMMTLEEWNTLQDSIAADQSGASALNGEPTSA